MTGRTTALSTKVAFSSRFVQVREDRVVFPNGSEGTYYPVTSGSGEGVVALVTCLMDGVENFLLVRQHRYSVDQVMWELPRGGASSATDSTEAARELVEETGVVLPGGAFTQVGVTFAPDSGLLTTKVGVWHALVESQGRDRHDIDSGSLEARWFPVGEVMDALTKTGLVDAMSLTALALYMWRR